MLNQLMHQNEHVYDAINDGDFKDLSNALKSGKRHILLFVDEKQCGYSRKMVNEVWKDLLEHPIQNTTYHRVLCNMRKPDTWASKFKVTAYPTTIMYDASGTRINTVRGYRTDMGDVISKAYAA